MPGHRPGQLLGAGLESEAESAHRLQRLAALQQRFVGEREDFDRVAAVGGEGGEPGAQEGRRARRPRAMADHVAEDRHRAPVGAVGEQVEVARDSVLGGDEGGAGFDAGQLGQLGGRQGGLDGAQVGAGLGERRGPLAQQVDQHGRGDEDDDPQEEPDDLVRGRLDQGVDQIEAGAGDDGDRGAAASEPPCRAADRDKVEEAEADFPVRARGQPAEEDRQGVPPQTAATRSQVRRSARAPNVNRDPAGGRRVGRCRPCRGPRWRCRLPSRRSAPRRKHNPDPDRSPHRSPASPREPAGEYSESCRRVRFASMSPAPPRMAREGSSRAGPGTEPGAISWLRRRLGARRSPGPARTPIRARSCAAGRAARHPRRR